VRRLILQRLRHYQINRKPTNMLRYLLPLVLIVGSVLSFIYITNPIYQNIQVLQVQKTTYQGALDNAKKLLADYQGLITKYNAFSPESLDRLHKILPDTVDNISLVLEMERLGAENGMAITNVQFDGAGIGGKSSSQSQNKKPYNELNITFSTQSTYPNFVQFMSELEKNLRVVDFSSVAFATSDTDTKGVQKYTVSITTYYLKQ
jgi:Tfp pilus assembly protein PilO